MIDQPPNSQPRRLLVTGAVHIDDIAVPVNTLVPKASNPVTWTHKLGGVAANAARAAACRLPHGSSVTLSAAVGDDPLARQLEQTLRRCDLEPHLVTLRNTPTGRYSAIMDNHGELFLGLADVSVAEMMTLNLLQSTVDLPAMDALLMDANLSKSCLVQLTDYAMEHSLPVAALSVSPTKTRRLLALSNAITLLFCNRREVLAMCPHLHINDSIEHLADGLTTLGFNDFVVTDGQSSLLTQQAATRHIIAVPPIAHPQNVNGAGDALAGATFAAWAHGQTLPDAVARCGLTAAAQVVTGERTAPRVD